MRKRFFIGVGLFLVCINKIFAVNSINFKNPGGVRVYHGDGNRYHSEEPTASRMIPDDTIVGEGDYIMTTNRPLQLQLDTANVKIFEDSVVNIKKLSSNQYALHLLHGKLDIKNDKDQGARYIVTTPAARYSFVSEFGAEIRSDEVNEKLDVQEGYGFAYSAITNKDLVVEEGGNLDFLTGKGDKVLEASDFIKNLSKPTIPTPSISATIIRQPNPKPIILSSVITYEAPEWRESRQELREEIREYSQESYQREPQEESAQVQEEEEETQVQEEQEEPQEEKLEFKRNLFGIELGLRSTIAKESADNTIGNYDRPSPFYIFAKPYYRRLDENGEPMVDLRFKFEMGYEYVNDAYRITWPQFASFGIGNGVDKYSSYYKPQAWVNKFSQFVDDIVVRDYFYLSRNWDLPLEFNNLNLRKHRREDNIYLAHYYENNTKQYGFDKNQQVYFYEKKLPFLLTFDIAGVFKFSAFSDDIENLNKYDPSLSDLSWYDGASRVLDLDFTVNPITFGFGLLMTKGAKLSADVGEGYYDDIFLTARVGSTRIDKYQFGFNTAFMAARYDYYSDGSRSINQAFTDMSGSYGWMLGFNFNVESGVARVDLGFDFQAGRLFTGIINRRSSFDSVKLDVERGGYGSLYNSILRGMYSFYPYIAAELDWGKYFLSVNFDLPVFFGTNEENISLIRGLKDWYRGDWLYRLNGDVRFRVGINDVFKLGIALSVEDLFPAREQYLGNRYFEDYFSSYYSWWNFLPEISFIIDNGPVNLTILAKHQRVGKDGEILKTYNPIVAFEGSVKFGNDYLFNKSYLNSQRYRDQLRENGFRFVFTLGLNYSSAKFYDSKTKSVLGILPKIGFKSKDYSFILKFDIENFTLPYLIFDSDKRDWLGDGNTSYWAPMELMGNYFDALIEELNIYNILKLNRSKGFDNSRRSLMYQRQFFESLDLNLNVFNVFDLYIPSFRYWVNSFMTNGTYTINEGTSDATTITGLKGIYFDLNLGYKTYEVSSYINFIGNFKWGKGEEDNTVFLMENNPISFNNEFRFSHFYLGIDLATTLNYDGTKFTWGLDYDKLDAKTWQAMGDVAIGYSNERVMDFILRFGFSNGEGMSYLRNDHLTTLRRSEAGYISYVNPFTLVDKDSNAYYGLSEFVDVLLDFHISKNISLTLWYNLPMAFINYNKENMSGWALLDRAAITFNAQLSAVDIYAILEKRGVGIAPGEYSWSNFFGDGNRYSMAFKLGFDFKAEYATFSIEAVSSHFIYGAADIGTTSPDKFAINVGAKFGFF